MQPCWVILHILYNNSHGLGSCDGFWHARARCPRKAFGQIAQRRDLTYTDTLRKSEIFRCRIKEGPANRQIVVSAAYVLRLSERRRMQHDKDQESSYCPVHFIPHKLATIDVTIGELNL